MFIVQYCIEDSLPSPTLRESTPLSANADGSVVQLPSSPLVKLVVLPAALSNRSRRCPR